MTHPVRSFAIAIALCLTACSLQTPAPARTTFLLGATRLTNAPTGAVRFGNVRIPEFHAALANRGTSLLYRETDQRIVADPYRQFVAPPAALIAERCRLWLAASGQFQSVLPADSRISSDTTLEGELVELYADVRDPKNPVAVLSLRASLSDARGNALRPEWRFTRRVALANSDAASVVAGLDLALAAALNELENALAH